MDDDEELRQPVVGVGGAEEDQGQDSHMPWSWRGGTRLSSGLIARQIVDGCGAAGAQLGRGRCAL